MNLVDKGATIKTYKKYRKEIKRKPFVQTGESCM